MPDITASFVKQYSTTLSHLVQQQGSRLRALVREEPLVGEEGFFNQVGAETVAEITNRYGDSPVNDEDAYRRRVVGRGYDWGKMIDTQDALNQLADPSSAYLQAASWAFGRKVDSAILAAASDTAYTGKSGTTTVALPSGQKVAIGGTGLTIAKLLSAKEILDAAEVDPNEPRYIACAARQITDLLGTTEVKSSDYNTVKALAQGEIDTFCGFKFIRTQLCTKASTTRYAVAWIRSGLLLAMKRDMVTEVTKRADKRFNWYAYASMTFGATRMQEEQVVEIACLES